MPFADRLIVWIIIGLVGGTLAGLIVTQQRRGFGFFQNLGIGLAGALIGGGVFRVFGLVPGLDNIAISLRDVVAAVAGSLLLVLGLWVWRRFRKAS
ncbi:MAG: GlsB/YeaQ/YmgE family stress response membrane protein [Alphaproteobacteria bacterium]|nr:GlsB/YeaQ/YmgE family stress response membrane protein [Alphaproteobacteria bacterium]MBV9014435.1 GlsB/YeaQ/YmgE family stress response membrane protein [Alphaproteobacteria bacterium]MBV9154073.1 GlsB/YeaQ/YmgE family stress response membrane protein [Alphaproteobacteria bacterium]MBV9587620.1 GlsB/YeaQ/YmgE family stress response membrane protein [Alphaproteobacteria bacterium]MBV9967680.1 GlsB/YeaQ/YmgE family stress response membrane protein [Alphaproteobacteria bacterium]